MSEIEEWELRTQQRYRRFSIISAQVSRDDRWTKEPRLWFRIQTVRDDEMGVFYAASNLDLSETHKLRDILNEAVAAMERLSEGDDET